MVTIFYFSVLIICNGKGMHFQMITKKYLKNEFDVELQAAYRAHISLSHKQGSNHVFIYTLKI